MSVFSCVYFVLFSVSVLGSRCDELSLYNFWMLPQCRVLYEQFNVVILYFLEFNEVFCVCALFSALLKLFHFTALFYNVLVYGFVDHFTRFHGNNSPVCRERMLLRLLFIEKVKQNIYLTFSYDIFYRYETINVYFRFFEFRLLEIIIIALKVINLPCQY